MASSPITSWQKDGETMEVGQHARDDGEGVEDLGDGEGAQEEVHGGVEAVLNMPDHTLITRLHMH